MNDEMTQTIADLKRIQSRWHTEFVLHSRATGDGRSTITGRDEAWIAKQVAKAEKVREKALSDMASILQAVKNHFGNG